MSERAKTLMQAVMELPEVERLEFASSLMDSFVAPPGALSEDDPDLEVILQSRLDEHLSGRDSGIPGDEVFRELREQRR